MLTRAVRRRPNLRHAQYTAEHIQLPWLCPALWSSHTTHVRSRSNYRPVAPRSSIEPRISTAQLSTNTRRQASAVSSPSLFDPKDAYTPFEYANPPSIPQPYKIAPLAADLSQILMIDHTTDPGPQVLESRRKHSYMKGNAWEVEATLDACLQIHRWDRAHAVLNQLSAIYENNVPELQRLYNKVLEAMVFDHIWNRTTENVTKINTWVEGVMSGAGVAPNAQTFALKIKAAMATLQGPKRDRTVRRYWDMAKEYNVDWEVASLREILSDSDLGKLSEISPFQLRHESLTEADAQESDMAVREDMVSQPALSDVRETAQKGLGMMSLKQSLSLFTDASQPSEWETAKSAESNSQEAFARQRQLKLEQDSLRSAVDRWRMEHEKMTKMGIAGNMTQGKLGALMWTWHQLLKDKIQAELLRVDEAELKSRRSEDEKIRTEYGPFLRLVDPQQLAALMVTSTIALMTKFGADKPVKLANLVTTLGRTIEQEAGAQYKEEQKAARRSAAQEIRKLKNEGLEAQETVKLATHHVTKPAPYVRWSSAQCAKLGSILCELLFGVAKMSVTRNTAAGQDYTRQEAAFDRRTTFIGGKKTHVVSINSELVDMLVKEPVADVIAKHLPMVCRPQQWTGFKEGGYLISRNSVLRVKQQDQAQRDYAKAASERGDLDELFKGLDVLGNTAWRINQNVFKVMLEAWNSGEGVAGLPPLEKLFPDLPTPPADAPVEQKYQYYAQKKQIENEKGGLHSNRCFQNFQMSIARALIDETFYLPHNVDFRGRAYPIPPYLNQMGADNARSLLLFEQGRKLGETGFRWLKVHLANVCGYDKASLNDRAQFADDHFEDICDSVQNPLTGRRWWLEAEDPWQCLATCHEILGAVNSGNPHTFVSHLPIHQDGTCNGLQHYAALGGDIAGARQVNLEPGEKPADVYTGVAELVKADIKRDAEAGVKAAKMLDGRITRKVVKQTVMTNVYGVTFAGAREQVKKQIDHLMPDLTRQQSRLAAMYIARKIFVGLGQLFEGAHDIQYWLGDCATRITNSISLGQLEELVATNAKERVTKVDRRTKANLSLSRRKAVDSSDYRTTIVWTTPLKLPVVQPYRITQTNSVKTHMASLLLNDPIVTDSVDKRKQLQAFPPNFIHSLDATHMMLSALSANKQGLVFSAVHDSFWTHAADIDSLNILLRDAFIRMHSEDIIGRLAAEFKLRYKGHLYLARVSGNSDLGQKILKHRRAVRTKRTNLNNLPKREQSSSEQRRQYLELVEEYKRQKLLTSEDPIERAEGETMTTAASIFEKFDDETYLKAKSSLGQTAVGSSATTRALSDALQEALDHDEEPESHDIDMTSTLEPLLKADSEGVDLSMARGVESRTTKDDAQEGSKAQEERNLVWLWLPLTFRPIPKKGDWDVARLKESVYFFS